MKSCATHERVFIAMKTVDIPLALTYDDVLLAPRFSTVQSRSHVDTGSWFTKQIHLSAPLVSANMDTVTETRMAIAVARFGGIGVIHRFLSIADQAALVTRVKRHQGHVIIDPVTIAPDATILDARALMASRGISGLPVISRKGLLLGIITTRDTTLADDRSTVAERMTTSAKLVTASPDISMDAAREILSASRLEKLPLVDAAGKLAGLITARDLVAATSPATSGATRDEAGRLRVAAAVGVAGDYIDRAKTLADAGADALVIDIAHGDSELMLNAVSALREHLGDIPLIAGNVATAEATRRLAEAGVDAVKVGVGPGSICITRQVAGVGVPQFTAVMECAEVGHEFNIPIVADGGIRYPGDVSKAIGAGASSVMLGSIIAGTEESPGAVISRGGRKMKMVRGMASREAALFRRLRENPSAPAVEWEDSEETSADEGVQAPVPYRGRADEILTELLGGLRSGMSYCDAHDIPTMWKNARFVRQTPAGQTESGSHDVG